MPPNTSNGFRPTEYVAPVLALLLALAGLVWMLSRTWERVRTSEPPPPPSIRPLAGGQPLPHR